MQAGIKRERFLLNIVQQIADPSGVQDHVPTVPRDDAGNENGGMGAEQFVAVTLLTRAWYARRKPVGIWQVLGIYQLRGAWVTEPC